MNPYQFRLSFIEGCIFKKANDTFKYYPYKTNEEANNFILSLLDDQNNYEVFSVLHALEFVDEYISEGIFPSYKVIERLFYLAFLDPKFISKFVSTMNRIKNNVWIYPALANVIIKNFALIESTIKSNYPLWNYILDILQENSLNAKYDPIDEMCNRTESTYIEVFVNYWPYEKVTAVKLKNLFEEFCNFCFRIKSDTSLRLLSILVYTFPIETTPYIGSNLHLIPSSVTRRVKEIKRKEWITKKNGKNDTYYNDGLDLEDNEDIEDKAELAIRMIIFNKEEAKEIAEQTPEAEIIKNLCDHYNPETHQFVF